MRIEDQEARHRPISFQDRIQGVTAFIELLHDNASPLAGEFYAALDLPATRYILQITEGAKPA